MIEIETKDIQKYEAKLIGPFTTRQTIFGVIGLTLAVIGFFATKDYLGDTALFVGVLLAFPFMLCGFYRPHNIPFEKFVKSVFISTFLAPTHRKYKTDNTYDAEFWETVKVVKRKPYKSASDDNQEI